MDEDYLHISPKELMGLAKSGDIDAFGRLYELYFVPVFRYIYFRVNSKEEAQDLVQTVFLKVYKSIPNYQERGKSPLAYFFTVARNTVIDYWKKNKDILVESPEETFGTIRDEKASPLDHIKQQESAEVVRRAIKQLSEDQKEVVVLKFINELSNKEIAGLLGKSIEAIRQLQCRALKALRTHLKDFKSS